MRRVRLARQDLVRLTQLLKPRRGFGAVGILVGVTLEGLLAVDLLELGLVEGVYFLVGRQAEAAQRLVQPHDRAALGTLTWPALAHMRAGRAYWGGALAGILQALGSGGGES